DIIGPSIGAPGDAERARIEADARQRQVADRIRFLGGIPIDDLLRRYRDYDLFVLPTLPGEGIPRVLLEAMASGLPVITTPVPGIPSLIVHDANGVLVDTPAAAPVADAILRVIDDGSLRRRLIANGYDAARSYTLQAQAASMMALVSSELGVTLRRPAAVAAG